MRGPCKAVVASADRGDELMDLAGVLDALAGLDAGTHVNGQRRETRPHLRDAIAHVCRCEPTRQNGVKAGACWQACPREGCTGAAVALDMGVQEQGARFVEFGGEF